MADASASALLPLLLPLEATPSPCWGEGNSEKIFSGGGGPEAIGAALAEGGGGATGADDGSAAKNIRTYGNITKSELAKINK